LSSSYSNLRQLVPLWLFLSISASFIICPLAWGHGVHVFAYVDGQKIFVEGYFTGKSKAVDSVVEVFDAQGNKLTEGRTDNNGVYSFKALDVVPVRGDLRIVLKAGPEHQAEFLIPASELPAYPKRKAGVAPTQNNPQPQEMSLGGSRTAETSQDQAALKRIVEEAVDSKIQPLETMLGKQQKLLMELKEKSISLTGIIGGIGWILGIVGVAAYLMSRRNMGKQ
jgi:nickel transport protein